jgi:Sec-independent protein translocase protein TatA
MGFLTAILVAALVAALLIRGPRNLPSIGRMLGRGVKATKNEVKAWHGDEPPPGPDAGSPGTPPPGP